MVSARPEDRIGDVIDRYRIERLLGAGGFGAVYAAQHVHMKRPVALKLLHREQLQGPKGLEMRNRFLREAQAAAAIGHPGIVDVYDSGIADEDTFVAMELLDGEDLEHYLRRQGTVSAASAVAFIRRLLEAVGAAHRAGIVHRDLKPANVFLVDAGEGVSFDERPLKLLDFGISKVRGGDVEKLTGTGMVMGTPHYMAPEMFLGVSEVDERADIYAVSAILYQMLSARPPHEATSYELLVVKVATTPAPSLGEHRSDLSPGLIAAVDRGLKTSPSERFASADEFAKALELADSTSKSMTKEEMLGETAMDLPSHVQRTNPVDSGPQSPSRNALAWLPLAAGAALLLALGGVWALNSGPSDSAASPESAASRESESAASVESPASVESVESVESAEPEPPADESAEPEQEVLPAREPSPMEPLVVMRANSVRNESGMSSASLGENRSENTAAPPTMSTTNTPMSAPIAGPRPGRARVACTGTRRQADMYLAGPGTRILVSSGRQRGITESSSVLRRTVQAQGRRILRCYGQEPVPIDQYVSFHVGTGGVVSQVTFGSSCRLIPRVARCLVGVFESIDFSSVQQGEGDARISFGASG